MSKDNLTTGGFMGCPSRPSAEEMKEFERLEKIKASAPEILQELIRADSIIRKLVKLVEYYGYGEELPSLRSTQRYNFIALTRKDI